MHCFHLEPGRCSALDRLEDLPNRLDHLESFLWIACTREELREQAPELQSVLQRLCGASLVDLHLSDLLNQQLRSHYDYTSVYDVLVFRRLTSTRPEDTPPSLHDRVGDSVTFTAGTRQRSGPPILRRIRTSPVGFALFDQVLLSVHPEACDVRESFGHRLQQAIADTNAPGLRLPGNAAELMLRMVSTMVDGYLALRKELTHQLDHWQAELLDPRTRFSNWTALFDARQTLHALEDVCEEQRACIQGWTEALNAWPSGATAAALHEQELLQVRSRDVLEHIERVVHHVRRLEQNIEAAVQIHFSAQGHRTNDIMRTLTAVTAIFLPLNLIAAIFGMNFDAMPLLHQQTGFWWALGGMVGIALTLGLVFWRKRYLARTVR